MEKNCSNHPESLSLAVCKACEKSICLMCVCDEKEGTFCSPKCVQVFREVSDWVEPGSAPVAAAAAPAPAAQAGGSVFDPEPAPPSQGTEQAEFEPLVTPGTKWRMIGSVCAAHTDTPAVATCEACDTTVCALCVVEADNGTYCAACAAKKTAPVAAAPARQRTAPAAPQKVTARAQRSSDSGSGLKWAIAVIVAALLGGGGWVLMNGSGGTEPTPEPKKDPVIAKTNPVKVDPPKIDPPKIAPPKIDPPKVDPPKVDPSKVDPKKVDPAKVNPKKVDPKKVEPPPKPKPPGVVNNPWTPIAPGAWYRMKIERAGKTGYADLVLKSRETGSYTLSTATGDITTTIPPYWVKGEETLTIDGQRWICEVREWESPPLRRWVLVESKNAGAVLKEESPRHKMTTSRLWEHTIRVGRRSLDCLVIEGDVDGAPVKTWYSALIPAGPVKWEMGDTMTTLVEMGDDASTRPAPPK